MKKWWLVFAAACAAFIVFASQKVTLAAGMTCITKPAQTFSAADPTQKGVLHPNGTISNCGNPTPKACPAIDDGAAVHHYKFFPIAAGSMGACAVVSVTTANCTGSAQI